MQPRLQILNIPLLQTFYSVSEEGRFQVHPHWHREIEILYLLEGNAKQQVGSCFFDTGRGDIVIIGSNQPHSTYSPEGAGYNCLVFVLDMEKLLPAKISHTESFLLDDFSSGLRYFPGDGTPSEVLEKLAQCLVGIKSEIESKNYTYECAVRQKLFEFMGLALRNGRQEIELSDGKSNAIDVADVLKGTFRLIEENYFEDIDLAKAARASNLSVTHFCRLFRSAAGMTFNEYLNRYRLNCAEQLLLSRKPEMEAALESGFGSFNSFLRNFKKYKNCTPSEYKRQNGIW